MSPRILRRMFLASKIGNEEPWDAKSSCEYKIVVKIIMSDSFNCQSTLLCSRTRHLNRLSVSSFDSKGHVGNHFKI